MNIESLPVKPGDKIDVVGEWQFPFLVKENRVHEKNAEVPILDHIRIHTFGIYSAIKFEGEIYIIPYSRTIKLEDEK